MTRAKGWDEGSNTLLPSRPEASFLIACLPACAYFLKVHSKSAELDGEGRLPSAFYV